jgi:hypothetical protein
MFPDGFGMENQSEKSKKHSNDHAVVIFCSKGVRQFAHFSMTTHDEEGTMFIHLQAVLLLRRHGVSQLAVNLFLKPDQPKYSCIK